MHGSYVGELAVREGGMEQYLGFALRFFSSPEYWPDTLSVRLRLLN